MGLSTVAVGMVPGTASIGVAAPLILLKLRLVQGFPVGGEWAGSALLAAEYAPAAVRGRYGMFTQLGVGSGLVTSSLLFLIVNSTIGETSPAFMDWGWRLPFLFSAVTRRRLVQSPTARGFSRRRKHGWLLHIGLHGQRVPD